ncbi:MAG TPA: hypothetical protein VHT73_05655 [Thermodesulfobacteriota bacterium]|nr:hypothetical protein [Thermodesulfobacteriota bacterium]
MSKNDLEQKVEHKITLSDREIGRLMLIVKERKVFWTVIPIDLVNQDGRKYQAGFGLVLAGIAPEREEGVQSSKGNVFKDLRQIANWLVPKDNTNIRCEIKTNISSFFYVPGEIDTERRNYILGIRIWNKGGMDEPVGIHQIEALKEMEERLKQIGCPKDRWKEHGEV